MSLEKNLLGVVPGLQATALLGYNVKETSKMFSVYKPKNMKMKGPRHSFLKSKKPSSSLIKTGVTNLVGIGLIGATAKAVSDLP